ncbi:MAG: hypothetical protein WC615_01680 [Mucilaginibacter sp.]|jgi:hypothetical protein|uniref:hypothetical protein n=1 Tax=Mucilaginibacter sp. TaxID=1882438 RepID=UPI00356503BB
MRLIFLFFFLFLSIKGFSQVTIKSEEAKDHVGEMVYLDDHIIAGKAFQDSIAVLEIGSDKGKSIVSVVVALKTRNTPTDIKVINTFKASKAYFRGIILPTASGYTIIVNDMKNIFFRSPKL